MTEQSHPISAAAEALVKRFETESMALHREQREWLVREIALLCAPAQATPAMEALKLARNFIEDSSFSDLGKERFDATLQAIDAAMAARSSADSATPVAWRVKDHADGWILCHTKEVAEHEAESGALVEALYTHALRIEERAPSKFDILVMKERDTAQAALAEIRQLIADGKLTGEYLIGAIQNIAEKGPVHVQPQTLTGIEAADLLTDYLRLRTTELDAGEELIMVRESLKAVLALFDDEGNLTCKFDELQKVVLEGYAVLGETRLSYELTSHTQAESEIDAWIESIGRITPEIRQRILDAVARFDECKNDRPLIFTMRHDDPLTVGDLRAIAIALSRPLSNPIEK